MSLFTVFVYAQLLRVRYDVSSESRSVWHDIRVGTDNFFQRPHMPSVVRRAYAAVLSMVCHLGPTG